MREFVGKNETLDDINPQRLQEAADRIYHRPRKELDFRTPHEVFSEFCRKAGLEPTTDRTSAPLDLPVIPPLPSLSPLTPLPHPGPTVSLQY